MPTGRQIRRVGVAFAKWLAAGRPVRTPNQIAELYEICKACRPNFIPPTGKNKSASCKLCGCRLNINGKINKLKMATEECPDNPPRWRSSVDAPQLPATQNAAMQAMRPAAMPAARNRKRRRGRTAPPVAKLPENNDPLNVFTKTGQDAHHVLRNLWAPSAGFLVGGGPSIANVDMSQLNQRGIVSMGINNVAGAVRLSAFVTGDPPEKFHHGIWLDPAILKFIPSRCLKRRIRAVNNDGQLQFTKFQAKHCPSVFAFSRSSEWNPSQFLKSEAATWGINKDRATASRPHIYFSFFLGLRLMHYLGCRRVYLAGVDFAMTPKKMYGFAQHRTIGSIQANNEKYRYAHAMCADIKPVFDDVGFEVFNTNPNSSLTVFPHVPFEKALADCRGYVPPEPFKLSGWYEKEGGQESDDRGTD